jgi:hypothetical protein
VAEIRRLTALGPIGTPYTNSTGVPCFTLELPHRPLIVTAKVAANLVVPPAPHCVVLHGPGAVMTPGGARVLGYRLATRTPIVMLDVEPMAARLIRAAVLDVLAWLAAGTAA